MYFFLLCWVVILFCIIGYSEKDTIYQPTIINGKISYSTAAKELTSDAKGWGHCFRAKLSEKTVSVTGAPINETPSCLIQFVIERDGTVSRTEVIEQVVYQATPQGSGNYRVEALTDVGRCLIDYLEQKHFMANKNYPTEVQYRFRPEASCPHCAESHRN